MSLITFGSLQAAPVSALVISTTPQELHVKAIVPFDRVIYLDSSGNIERLIGNTSDNIVPTVIQDNQSVPMNDTVAKQYQQILEANGGVLLAGQTYYSSKYDPYRLLASWIINNDLFSWRLV